MCCGIPNCRRNEKEVCDLAVAFDVTDLIFGSGFSDIDEREKI